MAEVGMQARPAEPFLASSLVQDGDLEMLFESVVSERKDTRRTSEVLETRVKSLDDMLEGGLEKGRTVGLSCEMGGGGATELSLTLLASSLLQDLTSTAAVIDTTGNLDILRLYTLILSRLRSGPVPVSNSPSFSDATLDAMNFEDAAAKVLDRVRIMRVFDLVGVLEAVGEIRDELERRKPTAPTVADQSFGRKKMDIVQSEGLPLKKTAVADSEDEDDDLLFDDEAASITPVAPTASEYDSELATSGRAKHEAVAGGKITFILFDNLAHVVNPLLKKDYVQAHVLSSSFLLALSHLTRTHSILTLILNPTTLPRPPPPKPPYPQHHAAPRHHAPAPFSVFSSNRAITSLGNLLTPYLDLHLMASKMPRWQVDAKTMYGDGARTIHGSQRGIEMANVVEVISDRWGRRVWNWGTFVQGKMGIRDA